MDTSKRPLDRRPEALKLINRCPVCAASYGNQPVQILARRDSASLIHLTCPECQGFFMAMVMFLRQGVSSVGMITDLSFEDVKRLAGANPISIDEVIEGHELLDTDDWHNHLVGKKSEVRLPFNSLEIKN